MLFYKYFILIILSFILLTACGGSSSSPTPASSDTPPPLPPVSSTTPTEISGVITGFGSVFINGVEYETDLTDVSTDDDDNANETDLEVGMIVTLSGSINDDGETGDADSIHYSEQIKGPLESIDLAANSLVILGQTIFFDELTSLDNVILADLLPNDFLEVSGFFNADDVLIATRIEREDATTTLKIQGVISQLNIDTTSFNITDMVINYSQATFEKFTQTDLVNDLEVKVKGDSSDLVGNVFTVNEIKLITSDEVHDEGDKRHHEGIINVFESTSSFFVNNVHIITDENTEFEHGTIESLLLNVRVKIKGQFNDEGSLLAQQIRIHQRAELKIEGPVQAIDLTESTITVQEVLFQVSNQTKNEDESDMHNRFFNIEDIVIGDFVQIKGFVDNNGNTIATQLKRENEKNDNETELKGKVSDISDFTFKIAGILVTTSETTLFEGLDGSDSTQASFFEQLQDDMVVEVKGNIVDNVFVAIKIEIDEQDHHGSGHDNNGNNQHRTEFRGLIEDTSSTNFIVSGHTVLVNVDTEFEFEDVDISAEQFWVQISIGDQIKVKGRIDQQGVITANNIKLED